MTTAPPPSNASRDRRRRTAAWALAYLVLAFVRLAPLSLHPAHRLADDGDALLEAWVVWWGSHHLFGGLRGLFDANAFYPHPGGLLYAEPLLAQSALGWPVEHLAPAALALNLLTIATFALTAFGFHLFARERVRSDAAAFVGAVLYAFNAYTLSNVARVHIVSLGWMPLALLALDRFFTERRPRWAWLFALFSVLHGLSSFYYLVFYLTALAVLLPAYAWAERAWRRPRLLLALGAAGLACGAVLALVAHPYLRLYGRYGFFAERKPFDLVLYFTPPRRSLVFGSWGDALRPPGFYLDYFLGFAALALAAVGVLAVARARPRTPRSILWLAWLVIAVGAFLLSAGPDVHWRGELVATGPYALLQAIGPFARMREPRRFAILVIFGLALFAARGAAALLARVRGRGRVAAAAALALVLGLEHLASGRTTGVEVPAGDTLPEAYRWLAARPGAEPVAELPVRPLVLQRWMALDQYLSTVHGKPITTGWPSFFPPALELFLWDLRGFPDARSITLLRGMGVRLAVVHPKRWESERRYAERRLAEREEVLPLLARFPDRRLAMWDRYGLGAEEVRALMPLGAERTPRGCACAEVDRRRFRVEASAGTPASGAADGSRATRWSSVAPQQQGMWFDVVLDRPRPVARLEIEMAFPYGEFGRYLEVTGYRGAEAVTTGPLPDAWYDLALLRGLVKDPAGARLRYDIRPAEVDRVRLAITRTDDGAGPWSIPEIHVFEGGLELDGR